MNKEAKLITVPFYPEKLVSGTYVQHRTNGSIDILTDANVGDFLKNHLDAYWQPVVLHIIAVDKKMSPVKRDDWFEYKGSIHKSMGARDNGAIVIGAKLIPHQAHKCSKVLATPEQINLSLKDINTIIKDQKGRCVIALEPDRAENSMHMIMGEFNWQAKLDKNKKAIIHKHVPLAEKIATVLEQYRTKKTTKQ